MKAIIQNRYGNEDTLEISEVENPKCLKPTEFLVEVKRANIASGDKNINTIPFGFPLNIILRLVFGLFKPRNQVRGISGSGVVVSIGNQIKDIKVGDHVNFINSMKASVMADFICLNHNSKYAKVDNKIAFEASAPIAFGAMTADYFINENTIKLGDQVLVYGSSGSVGTYASMLAKHYGAQVTGVMRKTHYNKLESIPFDAIIDYTEKNFYEENNKYDVIFDAVGFLKRKDIKQCLNKEGKFFTVKSPTKERVNRLKNLNLLLKTGIIHTIIDKPYPFKYYKEAHKHVYDGHKTGNVVLMIND